MAINRLSIWNEVNFQLKKENKFFTSSDILRTINDIAMRRVAEDVSYPRTSYSTYMTSGQYIVSSPIDFIKVDQNSWVTYESTSGNISKLKPKELREIGTENVLTAKPATVPQNYFMQNENLFGVYPPSTSGCIVIPYVHRPTDLSGDADVNEITERSFLAVVYKSCEHLMAADSDERSLFYKNEYDGEIKRLKGQYNSMMEITRDMKPSKDYAKRPQGT